MSLQFYSTQREMENNDLAAAKAVHLDVLEERTSPDDSSDPVVFERESDDTTRKTETAKR